MPPTPHLFLPYHLIEQLISFFPVKSLMRFKCVSKSGNILVSDPTFVQLHLQRSQRNKNLLLTYGNHGDFGLVSLPISCLLDNTSITLSSHQLKHNERPGVIGSCNGLICLFYYTTSISWFRVWNPATGTMSDRLGYFHKPRSKFMPGPLGYTFFYDISTDNYKIVAFGYRFIRVFCFNHNVWREIQSLPDKIVIVDHLRYNKSVCLDGTLIWLAFLNEFPYNDWRDTFSIVRYLIISLDLATETRRELLPPPVYDEVSDVVDPSISMLRNCLCFFYKFKRTHFVLWQMTQFGVEESWTQLFKISYENLQVEHFLCDFYRRLSLYPLYISENGATLILANDREDQALIYNSRDNRVERRRITNEIDWRLSESYVESLVPTN
ncbi:F-box/kelch-repeat protein At3g23880-like [Vicia villosa]|uniref:F-box/kelch-repeat protein At3g23880-like n=1 Tax=Vicia villosa TaxID=3911 RepID=UPI00273AB41D|nr:F-box/kelch-repeat protein At3g23880-like [Vicia villosa]